MLHGAGGSAANVMPIVADAAEAHGVIVLAPDSRGVTWDVIREDYGEDVAFLDRALGVVFRTCMIDPAHIAIAGFSDGASYALSLGLINGGLFSDIIAFSPGFALPTRTEDAPSIFICHGREDPVLPIERCGRRIAVRLRSLGYDSIIGNSPAAMSSPPRWSRRRFGASWPEPARAANPRSADGRAGRAARPAQHPGYLGLRSAARNGLRKSSPGGGRFAGRAAPPNPVTNRTGISGRRRRTACASSTPFMPGMTISAIINSTPRSGSSSRSSAAPPLPASTTS